MPRQKTRRSEIVVLREEKAPNGRLALPPNERRLSFGDRWNFAPAPEANDYIKLRSKYPLFIGGKFVTPRSGKYFDSINPATEGKLAEIAEGNVRDIDLAVKSARRAYKNVWSKMPRTREISLPYRAIDSGKIARAGRTRNDGWRQDDQGKQGHRSAARRRSFFLLRRLGRQAGICVSGRRPRPLGVAGQIIPWNFPLLMAAWKLAPALACGNTCVLKPAETPSITAMHLAEIFQEAELPDGVVNIVTGARETGRALVEHPDLDKIAFTGSTAVGKFLTQTVAGTKKKLTLELGGKAANIIFEDAAIDQAVEGIISGIYFNQGHVCCAGSRLLVQEGIFPAVIRKLRDRISTLRVGNPLDKNIDIGAINSRMQLDKICELVDSGLKQGAELVQPRLKLPDKGYWYPPSSSPA